MNGGAVAYLAHGQYGRNRNKIAYNNSEDYITGSSEGETNDDTTYKYNTAQGMLASTTGNIYGVYDMNGGVREGTATISAYNYQSEEVRISSKTMTASHRHDLAATDFQCSYITACQIGDGIKETFVEYSSWPDSSHWWNRAVELGSTEYPNSIRSSLFSLYTDLIGRPGTPTSSRIILL